MRGAAFAMLVSWSFVGCGENSDGLSRNTSEVAADAGGSSDSNAAAPSVYAFMTHVFDDTTASAYLTLLSSLDQREDIDLSEAAEFSGWANVDAFGGYVFISSSDAPELTRYVVSDRATLEHGETLSFANFTSAIAPLYANHFISETTALVTMDQTTRVLWDPSALEIRAEVEGPPVELKRDGFSLASYAYPDAVRPDGVFQSYYWRDDDWYAFHHESRIAVYDEDGGLKTLIEAPCPALHRASADEEGNLYFSPLSDIIAYQLLDEQAPVSCVVRINADDATIAAGWPRDFSELTDGRRTGEFQYLRDGRGILMVYHDERATLDAETVWSDLIVANNWRLWLVDLEAWEAAPIDELDWLAGGTDLSTIEGRTFLFTSSSDFSATTVYEISADGRVTRLFSTPGYTDKLVKVR
jgi:hypothetical protein